MEIQPTLTEGERRASTWMERSLRAAAEAESLPDAEVSVLIVDDEKIYRLNREYRGVDRPTDVLSFPQWEPEEDPVTEGGGPVPLGDIVISLPRAREQAEKYGHSLNREMGFLAVHGFLHLLGYDHGTEEAERAMFTRQEEILARIGLER
ncbi:rRNA maturation RNase YbeY [Paludifilum halophilum]|nr:rRNA maturation RNase YbeY [Paludifilum halophilum]